VSALVQTNFLVSALGQITQIEELELSGAQLDSMKLSVLVSCFSLGLGFASRDKADSAILHLPGKVGWGPTMVGLVLARSLEVFSRILAYNILQASLRGYPLLQLAGLEAVGLAFLAACLAFPDASWADAAAPRLGPAARSKLPKENSTNHASWSKPCSPRGRRDRPSWADPGADFPGEVAASRRSTAGRIRAGGGWDAERCRGAASRDGSSFSCWNLLRGLLSLSTPCWWLLPEEGSCCCGRARHLQHARPQPFLRLHAVESICTYVYMYTEGAVQICAGGWS